MFPEERTNFELYLLRHYQEYGGLFNPNQCGYEWCYLVASDERREECRLALWEFYRFVVDLPNQEEPNWLMVELYMLDEFPYLHATECYMEWKTSLAKQQE